MTFFLKEHYEQEEVSTDLEDLVSTVKELDRKTRNIETGEDQIIEKEDDDISIVAEQSEQILDREEDEVLISTEKIEDILDNTGSLVEIYNHLYLMPNYRQALSYYTDIFKDYYCLKCNRFIPYDFDIKRREDREDTKFKYLLDVYTILRTILRSQWEKSYPSCRVRL